MRPIERGPRPLNADGSPMTFSTYGNARRDLIDRMGQYCAYCNQKLPSSLAVEHVKPKSLEPDLELEWDNFLLACTNCNSIKGDTSINLNHFIWPDVHNTHLAFVYSSDGKVKVNPSLSAPLKIKALELLDLVGLQKYPNNPTASDRRWLNRKDAFVKASTALFLYTQAAAKGAAGEVEQILGFLASENGFFSIWMQIFDAHPTVKKEIVNAFIGTANCYDSDFKPVNRTAEL